MQIFFLGTASEKKNIQILLLQVEEIATEEKATLAPFARKPRTLAGHIYLRQLDYRVPRAQRSGLGNVGLLLFYYDPRLQGFQKT